ncbi:zinc-binding dehydrogenase, partial [bacterium]|nr:zinc-binding dehydrogenase [bacterium]
MKAMLFTRYGGPDVLQPAQIDTPMPNDHEVRIQIHAGTVTSTECTFRKGQPIIARLFTGLTKPKLKMLGEELAGVVDVVGREVTRFKPGDEVFGITGESFGANAEYICLPEDATLALKPANISFAEAVAPVDGVLTALPFLRDEANLSAETQILINGASGAIGTSAVQLAKQMGAEVTGVCSTANVELVRSLGADHVIDYKKEDFTRSGRTWDVIFDTVGKLSFPRCKRALKPHGLFLETGISGSILF